MDRLEKAERLMNYADITFEEAKAALDACGDDMLEAVVYLEKRGKSRKPGQSSYSTAYEQQPEYVRGREKVDEQEQQSAASAFGHALGRGLRTLIHFVKGTTFCITHKEKNLFTMPSWVALLILVFSWHVSVPALIIALFFGCRYSFKGETGETEQVNDILNKAGSFADEMEGSVKKEAKPGEEGWLNEEKK